MYKLMPFNMIKRLTDGAFIPTAEGNTDYQDYLKWIADGNTPEAQDPDPVKTYTQLRQEEYMKRGVTIEALSVALWEKYIEDRPDAATSLQAIREEVKTLYPKS
jgi:hypothetical protein